MSRRQSVKPPGEPAPVEETPTPEAPEAPEVSEVSEVRTSEAYNPFEHRNVSRPTSDFGALAHMLKTSLGSGILAMPMAFKNSGLIFGAVGTTALGIICVHCIYMLVRNSQRLCVKFRVPTLSYSKTTEKAFECGPYSAKKYAKAVGISVIVQLLSSFVLGNTVYVVFMSQSLNQIVHFFANRDIDVRLFSVMLWIPLILMCMVRDLKTLVPFSILANLLIVVSFAIILYYVFRSVHDTSSVYLMAPFSRMPLFITTVLFAIEGIGTVLSIEHEMKNPQHFVGGRCPVAYIAMAVVIFLYTFIGFFGYLQYGESTRGSIALNLPVTDLLAQVVKILVAGSTFFTYGLQFYVPINLLCDLVKGKVKAKYYLVSDLSVRVGLVSLTIILAVAIPNLEPIISLVGAICFSTLGLLIPALIDVMARYPIWGRFKWHLVKDIIIAVVSVVAMVSGSYASIINIIESYGRNQTELKVLI